MTVRCWLLAVVVGFLAVGNRVGFAEDRRQEGQGLYEPTWESLKRYRVPRWYKDAKFGIFIHWGVYAVPARGTEWYPRHMYREKSRFFKYHKETWGDQSKFGYKDFVPLFKAERWDPDAWAKLFADAGARFVVPVAEHHDGFAMYASSHTRWNSVDMGPHRDVLGELGAAVRKHGMKLGASTHYAHNWRYYPHDDRFDTNDPRYYDLYNTPHSEDTPASAEFLEHWYARTKEIVDKYQPSVLWFDFGFNRAPFEPYRRKIAAYYYNKGIEWGKPVVLNYKMDAFPDGAAVLDLERGKLGGIRFMVWQTDTSVSRKSWGYIEDDEFKSTDSLVDDLVDIVSKNGVLLLNVGPKADGTIPEPAKQILLGIGRWLRLNGEAIYGTRPWHTFGEGPTVPRSGHQTERKNKMITYKPGDIRFTTKPNVLYAICLAWPGQKVNISSLSTRTYLCKGGIRDIRMLGDGVALKWKRDASGLTVEMPQQKPCDYAYVLKIRLNGRLLGRLG